MASDPFISWSNRTVLRPGREEPYLSIQDIVVFVRDLDVSKRFYLEQLGFELLTEQRLPTGERWIEVAPPDGSANLALVEPKPDAPEYKLIGGYRWVLFMTEDVHAKYKEWSERGVRFTTAPETPGWGGTYARFEDPDGNAFGLEGFDEVRQSLELRRRAHAEKLESERRTAQEMDIARQVQARLFPQIQPEYENGRVRGYLPAGAPGGRGLFRFPESRAAAAGVDHRRCFRQGDRRRAADGESAGQPAEPVSTGLRSARSVAPVREPPVL